MGSEASARRSTRRERPTVGDGNGNGNGTSEEATETFTFTPINAMRSLENVELSAERRKDDAVMGGKRARRGTPVREVEGVEEEAGVEEETEERRASKTFWARERQGDDARAAGAFEWITADACGVQRGAVAELDSDS